MKGLFVVLLIASLSMTLERTLNCSEVVTPSAKSACHESRLDPGIYKCCFENYTVLSATHPTCVKITQSQFKDFNNFMEERKKKINNYKNYVLDCSSEYITISILSLILLLL